VCLVERFGEKGGVVVGNGRAPSRPTIHPPDRTAARFWIVKVLVLRFGGLCRPLGGASRGRSERGRSEVVVLVREVVRVTAVHSASCGGWW
jgi:hypothetical protein